MIDTQEMRREVPPTVLALVAIAGQDVATAEMDSLTRQAIECKQADDSRDLNLEINGSDPIVVGLFQFGTQFAHFAPGFKGIGAELVVFEMNDLSQLAAKQCKSPANIDDMDGHVEAIEDQNAARQGAGGGGRGGRLGNRTPVPRAMHPGRVRFGCLKALHDQPPMLCQSFHCSRFFRACQLRPKRFVGGNFL